VDENALLHITKKKKSWPDLLPREKINVPLVSYPNQVSGNPKLHLPTIPNSHAYDPSM
jgi:hypothetical protein